MMHRFFRRLREWFRPTGYFIIVPEGSTLILQGSPKIDFLEVHGSVTLTGPDWEHFHPTPQSLQRSPNQSQPLTTTTQTPDNTTCPPSPVPTSGENECRHEWVLLYDFMPPVQCSIGHQCTKCGAQRLIGGMDEWPGKGAPTAPPRTPVRPRRPKRKAKAKRKAP